MGGSKRAAGPKDFKRDQEGQAAGGKAAVFMVAGDDMTDTVLCTRAILVGSILNASFSSRMPCKILSDCMKKWICYTTFHRLDLSFEVCNHLHDHRRCSRLRPTY